MGRHGHQLCKNVWASDTGVCWVYRQGFHQWGSCDGGRKALTSRTVSNFRLLLVFVFLFVFCLSPANLKLAALQHNVGQNTFY